MPTNRKQVKTNKQTNQAKQKKNINKISYFFEHKDICEFSFQEIVPDKPLSIASVW